MSEQSKTMLYRLTGAKTNSPVPVATGICLEDVEELLKVAARFLPSGPAEKAEIKKIQGEKRIQPLFLSERETQLARALASIEGSEDG